MKIKSLFCFILSTLILYILTGCTLNLNKTYEFGLRTDDSYLIKSYKSQDDVSIEIPSIYKGKKVKGIGRSAFEGLEKLTTVIIPEGIEFIETDAFKDCVNLENISLPSSIKEIESGAFEGCSKLNYNVYENGNYIGNNDNLYVMLFSGIDKTVSSFKIHEDCNVIYSRALNDFKKLKQINLSNSIKCIGYGAFENCSLLEEFLVPNLVEYFDASWFNNCSSLKKITIGTNIKLVEIGYMLGCDSFSEFNVLSSNTKFASKDGVLYSKDLKTLLVYPKAKKDSEFSIPSYVENISTQAFYECKYLKSISLWSTVKELRVSAVINCNLLHTIKFNGTTSEWVKLDNENLGWDKNFSITKVYCSNGVLNRSKA